MRNPVVRNPVLRASLTGLFGVAFLGVASCTGVVDGQPTPGGPTQPGGKPAGTSMPGNGAGPMTGGGQNPGGGGNNPGTGNGGGGSPSNPGGGGSNPGDPPPAPTAQVMCSADGKESIGRRALRRLTVDELDATVRTAFGLTKEQWAGPTVPPDPSSLDGFSNNLDRLVVGPDYARGVLDTGRTVAQVVTSPAVLARVLPCGATGGAGSALAPCAMTFITTYGPKLYRRPLTTAEIARYMDLFMKVGRADFKTFVHWATLTMLQSPRVLYRSELGKPDGMGRYKLTSYEIASALSYTFTGGPPDAALMMLAAGDRLQTADQIEAAAKSLVYDAAGKVKPAFAASMLRFADDYLGLSTLQNLKKDDQAFPDFTPEIQTALGHETQRFLSHAMFEEKASPAALLTAPYTFMDARLAKYYGVPATGADFTKVNRPEGWGVGLLSQGSLLAVESHSLKTSPTKRGYFIRTRLLCASVPPPPPVVGDLPAPTEGETTRQRYEELHLADAGCKACHKIFDPIGFGFEHLDATGRYRAKEGRFDIDDSGEVIATSAGDIKFRGPTELAQALAKLPELSGCMASYLAAYAFGLSQANAPCLVRTAADELAKGNLGLVDFYIRMVRSEHFRTRLP